MLMELNDPTFGVRVTSGPEAVILVWAIAQAVRHTAANNENRNFFMI